MTNKVVRTSRVYMRRWENRERWRARRRRRCTARCLVDEGDRIVFE